MTAQLRFPSFSEVTETAIESISAMDMLYYCRVVPLYQSNLLCSSPAWIWHLKPFTSCCIGSAGHRTTTTTTSPNLPMSSYSSTSSPEFAFPAHAPSLIRSQSFPASFAGGRWGSLEDSPVQTIPAGLQDTEWGTPTSLDGLLGTVFICHEALQQAQAKALHAAGRPDSVINLFNYLATSD